MSRRWTRLLSRFLIAALLASQGMLAAHACGQMGAIPMAMAMTAQLDADVADDAAAMYEHCGAPTALCHEHCKGDPATADNSPASVPADFVPAFSVALHDAHSPGVTGDFPEPALTHATSPPPAIRHCCWRI